MLQLQRSPSSLLLIGFLLGYLLAQTTDNSWSLLLQTRKRGTPEEAHQNLVETTPAHESSANLSSSIVDSALNPANGSAADASSVRPSDDYGSQNDTDSIVATSSVEVNHGSNLEPEPAVCLTKDFYGGHSNRIITLGNALKIARSISAKVAISTTWASDRKEESWEVWFRSLFDPHPDILMWNDTESSSVNCIKNISASRAFKTFHPENHPEFCPELAELIPSKEIRGRAEKESKSYSPFVSVHRRAMNGCYMRAEKLKVVGGGANCTTNLTKAMCDVTFENVAHFNPHDLPVVLFTDGLRPEFDQTFPYIDDHDFFTQYWMMVLSDIHIGNPVSTVDRIVMHWRYAQGRQHMEPRSCYQAFDESFINMANDQ